MKKKISKIVYLIIGIGLLFIFFRPDQKESVYSSMLVIVTSVSVLISYMMYDSQTTPKLYVLCQLKEAKHQWDWGIMNEFIVSQTEEIEGLAYVGNDKNIILEIHNNGNVPAVSIRLEYSIVTYINEIKFGVDKAEILDYKSVKLEKVFRTIEYDYIPPGDLRSDVVFCVSKYPMCDIVVHKLKCSEQEFISSDTVVFSYKDERFEKLGDSQDLLILLGLMKGEWHNN